jgi:hypothetical protein
VTGISVSVNMNYREAEHAAQAGGVRGLNMAADRLVALSVPLTPIDIGDLREGTVPTYANTETLESKVSNDMEYAARQHEELSWRHPEGGQAKFLEGPARDNAGELMDIVGAQIRRSLRS